MKGEIYALLSAITWGCAVVLFKRGGDHVGPVVLNLFKNVLALVLLFLTLAVLGEVWAPFALLSWPEFVLLCLSGVLGIAIADSLLFASLNRIGVARVAVVDCFYMPSIIFFSWLLLDEQITLSHYIGGALILGGVLISGIRQKNQIVTAGAMGLELWYGMALGVVAIVLMAFGIVMAKPMIQKVPLVWSTTVRLVAGSVFLVIWLLLTRKGDLRQLITPNPGWKFIVAASFLGAYVAMLFWIGGFKYAKASVAGLLNQSSAIFAILLSVIFLREALTPPKIAAILLASTGVIVVSLRVFS